MKTTTVASALTLCSAALAAPLQARHNASDPFTLDVYYSNLPPVSGPISANGGSFWIGKNTSSYCPSNVEDCPAGTSTSFLSGSYGTLYLNTEVPGGQQVYIAPNGLLTYTQPHSAYIPANSTSIGLSVGADNQLNPLLTYWACSTDSADTEYQIWLQYRDAEGTVVNNGRTDTNACAQIDLVAKDIATGAAAWEYN